MTRRGTLPLALLLLLAATTTVSGQGRPVTDSGAQTPPTPSSFTPKDNFLIDCGGTAPLTADGKSYKTDAQANHLLSATDAIRVAADDKADVPSPLYATARVFKEEAVYSFPLTVPGWHFIRLYFFPLKGGDVDLASVTFSVVTDDNVLLHSFTPGDKPVMKEYLVNATENHLALKFQPLKGSAAFVNAIEVVNAPDELITDSALAVAPLGEITGLVHDAYQVVYRINVGGPAIGPAKDTLGRRWESDAAYVQSKEAVKDVSVPTSTIKFPDGTSRLVAPALVYASAAKMADADVASPNFNLTWKVDVDASFSYLVRLFFADIVSKATNDLYFDVYLSGRKAVSGLDLSTVAGGELAAPYYKDFVVNSSALAGADGKLSVQVGPMGQDTGRVDALLNGVEVLKMSNSVGSLDGEFGVDGQKADDGSGGRKAVAAVGFAMMFGAFAGLGAMVVKWYKRPQDWERRESFSSWLLPIHTGQSFTSGSGGGKSGNTFSSTMGLGRFFSFAEIQAATQNFDEKAIIGVGGFGNVYVGEIDDGTKVAVKRGSAESEQGINEFNTEIQMLSKLRHRHLVSLIGYCDENQEMILVYEYMHNGVFRDHIYGSEGKAPLPWKQRLEICIGAARGLHYLHTGTAQGIIHRDVKTTNILLDDNFVAKVSDFGLSKDGPGMNQLHVSTAVKGSFGYLDPEYFRCQQLTDKSDVYSFGVVLLEALCARPPIDPQLPREQVSLAEWGMQWKRKGLIEKIMDPTLAGTVNPESLAKFAETAEKCLAEFGSDRISMGDVLWNLEYALQLQDANPPEGGDSDGNSDGATAEGGAIVPAGGAVPDASTAAAGELFQQLADMKGR
ncbi:probable receptor-like protein kinase At2g21480 [Zea mays]|uniref:Protein kinase domain-containing protein n=1 Tax=Zea mays TaxID=4577 RepID=A0A804PTJ3_MAIZE|nr:probable receptor-like protein kinase At2g21480 [Zea mays]|eukprot:XP_008648764.1 probable receptor-like protein kinase At2g21480 [Zea mays]